MNNFDLEKAIKNWKKSLFKDPGLEESHVIELEEGLREEIEELTEEGMNEEQAFLRASKEFAPADVLGGEFYKVRTTRRSGRPPWQAPRFMPSLLWHYLKTSLRKIKRQKIHSLINVTGLSVGMACFLMIMTSVQFEMSYDRFHEKSDRLFRIGIRNSEPEATDYSITTPAILSESLINHIPEVKNAGIIQRSRNAVFQTGSETFTEDGLFADENFLDLFSFELLRGHPSEALKTPNSVVLTDVLAQKIFGSEDPVGKNLRYKSRLLDYDLNITGIVKHPPKNSHLQFDYLVSTSTMASHPSLSEWFQTWDIDAFYTYAELQQNQSKTIVEQKAANLIREARPQIYKREDPVYLQPVTDIHLKSQVSGATASNNRIQTLYFFSTIALLILMIAGINSMNISTALAETRAKEISMRKVIGARRAQLVRQFLGESYVFTCLAMVFALLIFLALFPVFSRFLGNDLSLSHVEKMPLVLSILITLLFVGAFSGIYPSLVLSAFQPTSILKKQTGTWIRGKKTRNLLVIFQFSAVVVLMIGTIVITRQLNYIKNKNLGYEREHVVILPLNEDETIKKSQVLKTRLLEYSGVQRATVTDSSPLSMGVSIGGASFKKENGETIKMDYYLAQGDHDFLQVFGMKIAKGRDFSKEFTADSESILVNEAFVKKVGWKEPIGKQFKNSSVIGVVEDFHFDTLHKRIEPAVFTLSQDFFGRVNLAVRIRPDNPKRTLDEIRRTFNQTSTSQNFNYYFLDDAFNRLYRNEQRLASTISYLEGLAIILGFMGLFGLATYATQRRSKEIGIRKVLGASALSIVRMISSEFIILVVVSNIIAWPVGYIFLRRWLQGYAYRCSFGFEIFVLTGLGTLLIALLAVGLQTIKAAYSNPVESIRYE